jgi:RHS repeat-associated protein
MNFTVSVQGQHAPKVLAIPAQMDTVIATFVYDGDGNRVAQTIGGTTTYFVGNYYEKTGSTITKYYYAGSQRVAIRKGSTLSYLLSDHLGSTSLTINTNGSLVAEMRYKAWGETRYTSGTMPTRYTYTGQYSNVSDFGWYYYNARWYDPALGRMAQADTVVPGGVQGYDRYAYVSNNPIRYNDPSGHCPEDDAACRNRLKDTLPKIGNGNKKPIWSTAEYKNEWVGDLLSGLSTKLQHGAEFFSDLGAASEIGFTTAGLLFGGAAVGWVDLGFPIADVSGGLAGGLVGWEVGHGIHLMFTNSIESGTSNLSTISAYASDLAYGNTRLDIYDTNATVVIGQPTVTSTTLALIGGANTVGIVDAGIDQVGSLYADRKIGGVYDLFGVTGKTFQPFVFSPYINIQLGDR